MPISREEFNQKEERIKAAEKKIQSDLFRKNREWMFSIEEIAKKLSRFSLSDVESAIVRMEKRGLLVCEGKAGKMYYGLKYI